MKDYYQILGVNRYATAREIKLAYRKLAVLYHPDRNDTKEAELLIKEINEAYHVLGDHQRRRAYDHKLYRPIPKEQEIAKYQEKSTYSNPFANHGEKDSSYQPYKSKKQDGRIAVHRSMQKMNPRLNQLAYVAFLFCIFLVVDYSLPYRESTQEVVAKVDNVISPYASILRPSYAIHTSDHGKYAVSIEHARQMDVGTKVTIVKSRLGFIPIRLELENTTFAKFSNSIYGNFLIFPALLIITSGLVIFLRHSVEFRFSLGILNVFMLVGSILLIFSNFL